jgi:crotonobetainyl-CoA:carnitine CoA-transferase CaiB-like acyl-CoA transferase
VTDITAGILGAMGIAAAYAHKLKTGVGQRVDTSLFEAGISQTYWQSAIALATGEAPTAMGSAHPLNAPYQAFQTEDGWINVGAANQSNWERLIALIERPELQRDPRFSTNDARMRNREQLVEVLGAEFRKRSSKVWLDLLDEGGLPAGPILNVSEMHHDPQTLARDMIVATNHPVAGEVKTIGMPVKFSETPCEVRSPAPLLGQHTREVLTEAGFSIGEVDQMILSGDASESGYLHS